jgi:DNA-binding NtrC family response regulator
VENQTETSRQPAILVLDDDAVVREGLLRALRRAGYRAIAANNLADAVAALQRARFALVIADLRVPGGGVEQLLAERGALADVPVLAITGAHEPIALGVPVLLKPFNATTLIERVSELLRAPRRGHNDAPS